MAAAPIEMSVRRRPAPVETPVDPVSCKIEPLRGHLVPGSRGAIRRAIEPPVCTITAPVQAVLDPAASLVEALLDPVAASIGAFRRVRPNVRRAHE